jgi:hypothetical protein
VGSRATVAVVNWRSNWARPEFQDPLHARTRGRLDPLIAEASQQVFTQPGVVELHGAKLARQPAGELALVIAGRLTTFAF